MSATTEYAVSVLPADVDAAASGMLLEDGPVSEVEAEDVASLFRLLGDPTRTRILYALVAVDELCVSDIARRVGSEESTVSHALRLLRTAGVVRSRRQGRNVHYRLDDSHVRMLLDVSRDHLRHAEAEGAHTRG